MSAKYLIYSVHLLLAFIAIASGLPHSSSSTSSGHKDRIFFNGVDSQPDSPKEVFASVGGTAVLECEAGGTPAPLIHWLHNGQRIDQDGEENGVESEESLSQENTEKNRHLSTLQLSATKSRLYIDCVRPSDAGVYACIAETPTRRIAIDYVLRVDNVKAFRARRHLNKNQQHRDRHSHRERTADVNDGSTCLKNLKPGSMPARIYMWTIHRVELEGADVQLYCRPTGGDPVKVTWYDRNGDAITEENQQYRVLRNGDLVVSSITWAENMGVYKCVAENQYGSDAVDTFLYPAAKERKQD